MLPSIHIRYVVKQLLSISGEHTGVFEEWPLYGSIPE